MVGTMVACTKELKLLPPRFHLHIDVVANGIGYCAVHFPVCGSNTAQCIFFCFFVEKNCPKYLSLSNLLLIMFLLKKLIEYLGSN